MLFFPYFSALLLNSIISAFKPEFVGVRAVQFTDMIRECEETGFPKVKNIPLCPVIKQEIRKGIRVEFVHKYQGES